MISNGVEFIEDEHIGNKNPLLNNVVAGKHQFGPIETWLINHKIAGSSTTAKRVMISIILINCIIIFMVIGFLL